MQSRWLYSFYLDAESIVDQALARGDSEDAITQAFVQEFGTKVYAEPPHSGFSLVAWSMPAVYLAIGLVLVFVISRWRSVLHTRSAVRRITVASPRDAGASAFACCAGVFRIDELFPRLSF